MPISFVWCGWFDAQYFGRSAWFSRDTATTKGNWKIFALRKFYHFLKMFDLMEIDLPAIVTSISMYFFYFVIVAYLMRGQTIGKKSLASELCHLMRKIPKFGNFLFAQLFQFFHFQFSHFWRFWLIKWLA